jgi:hypothetical protein
MQAEVTRLLTLFRAQEQRVSRLPRESGLFFSQIGGLIAPVDVLAIHFGLLLRTGQPAGGILS